MKGIFAFIAISIIAGVTLGYRAAQINQHVVQGNAALKTTLMQNGEIKNIEIEISGLIPNKRFEVSWTDFQCRNLSTTSKKQHGLIVSSDQMGSLIGYIDIKEKLTRHSILVTNIENGQHLCFNTNV